MEALGIFLLLKLILIYIRVDEQHKCESAVHRLMPSCFCFKNHLHFPNDTEKKHNFTKSKSCLKKKFILFLFTILNTDPNKQMCKISAS